ncbi:MAG: HAMP domain-containing protein [Caulobacteraceae bacterium]
MAAASSISAPVARLVHAADRVAGGDLDARVETKHDPEEIAVLSHAFNRMTSDLQEQQMALRQANTDADSRRQFIETVLSEVSAGVIGLDAAGRISAVNRRALAFLSLDVAEAFGRPPGQCRPGTGRGRGADHPGQPGRRRRDRHRAPGATPAGCGCAPAAAARMAWC